MLRHRSLWFVCFSLLSIPLSVSAQTTTGTVRGYVKDQNGTTVGDAQVQATQTGTGVVRSTTTRLRAISARAETGSDEFWDSR